jgi:DNA-binding transcriptional MerR regulator
MFLTMTGAIRATDRSADTLKAWERLGLIKPERDSRGRRLYSPECISEIKRLAAERQTRHALQISNLNKGKAHDHD